MRADSRRLGYVGGLPVDGVRDSDSWYTPARYIESARTVLGGIELDPFTSVEANHTVGARRIFTQADNALQQDWSTDGYRSLWMNPPYGKLMASAVTKFMNEWLAGKFDSAIVLCNNATDTRWWRQLTESVSMMCFTDHRIGFTNVDGKNISSNTRGQVFLYYGPNITLFKQEFNQYGLILVKG